MESLQLDPLQATARSQDLALHSRILGYKPEYLEQVMYKERKFFDYGGLLSIYPMSELPYWRHHMEQRSKAKRVEDFTFHHPGIFEQVREELRSRGPLGNRHVDGNPVEANYRGRKDTSLVLYDMWISGELMIHHRDGFSRVYDFRENVAPRELDYLAPEDETVDYFARKCIAFKGLIPEGRWKTDLEYFLRRKITREEMKDRRDRWFEEGLIETVQIEGIPGPHLVLASDLPLIDGLAAGRTPRAWKPLETSTLDEVVFLAPLDIVIARGRAKKLFDFDYLWEVYKPVHQRRWGYYTLPILYGDELVARMDARLDRTGMLLQIRGFWHEPAAPIKDPAFQCAFAKGLERFAGFLHAAQINLSGIGPRPLRNELKRLLSESLPVSTRAIVASSTSSPASSPALNEV